MDPAIASPFARWQICEELSDSTVLYKYEVEPVQMKEIYRELQQKRKYSNFLHRLYGLTAESNEGPHKYTNPYALQEFEVYKFFPTREPETVRKEEYVFVCLLKRKASGDIVPFYVSKLYDPHHGLHAHRYLFLTFAEGIGIAERSAEAKSTTRDFNLELHYLELRKHHERGKAKYSYT